jgi:hypothetical protein
MQAYQRIELKSKQQIVIIEMPKSSEILLLSINLSQGKINDENSRMICIRK